MSIPKIIPVDSEAHAYEISSHAVKNKKILCPLMILSPKMPNKGQKTPKTLYSKH